VLTYIFGQNGPGPIGASSAFSAASVVSGSAQGVVGGVDVVPASGRDVSGGADVVLRSGLLAGKHDGNNAAYDMKSLGKHIEAVRSSTLSP
jgi:dynamin 1-like protein